MLPGGADIKIIKRISIILTIIILLVTFAVLYAFKIEPFMLTVNEIELKSNNNTDMSISVIQLSDLEISRYYTEDELLEMVGKVNRLNPDIIVFTGDLFSNYAKYHPVDEVTKALKDMNASLGKYAVWGNNDYGGGAVRVYADIMAESDFHLLKNEGVMIPMPHGGKLFIGGIDDASFGTPDLEKTMRNMDKDSSYRILLAHEPKIADSLAGFPVDLLLSGHTHGGQVRLPFLNSLLGYEEDKYIRGLYELDNPHGTLLYVNSGMGTSRIPVRFLVPPQIAVFSIQVPPVSIE